MKRATRGVNDLKDREFRIEDVRSKIEEANPRWVCFNGKSGYQAAVGKCDYGLQDEDWKGIKVYVAPSTSGALPMKRVDKLKHYRAVKQLLQGQVTCDK